MVFDEDTLKRFWSKVDIKGPDECWLWKAALTGHGYGGFMLKQGIIIGASRFALFTNAPDDNGLCALHKCDNRRCCNPNHLYWGDKKQNALDRVQRHQFWTSGDNIKARRKAQPHMTYLCFCEIMELLNNNLSLREISSRTHTNFSVVARIKKGSAHRKLYKQYCSDKLPSA